jgi:hypothetical protein
MRRNDFILVLSAATVVKLSDCRCCCDALVVPFRSIVVVDHRSTSATTPRLLQSSTMRSNKRRRRIGSVVVIAASSSSNDDDEDDEEDVIRTTEENDNDVPVVIFNKDVSERSSIDGADEGPSTLSRVTYGIFRFFSYCVQAAGAFFFVGLLLNFAGFGYTIDMEHGLVIDKMQNIRNTVQFEMEIQREEREDVMMKAGSSSSSSSGAVGSTKLLESSFRDYSEQ